MGKSSLEKFEKEKSTSNPTRSLHRTIGHGQNYLGARPASKLGQIWFGTPTWAKSTVISYGSRGLYSIPQGFGVTFDF